MVLVILLVSTALCLCIRGKKRRGRVTFSRGHGQQGTSTELQQCQIQPGEVQPRKTDTMDSTSAREMLYAYVDLRRFSHRSEVQDDDSTYANEGMDKKEEVEDEDLYI